MLLYEFSFFYLSRFWMGINCKVINYCFSFVMILPKKEKKVFSRMICEEKGNELLLVEE